MKKYQNKSGISGIVEYEIGDDHIKLRFATSRRIFTYSYSKAGKEHVEMMKKLALSGIHLNTYVNQHVKELFD
jgi:hypothetical protein